MRIVYLAAGAAGMFCGACLHDNTLGAALDRLGEDILLVPTYTPLRVDEPSASQQRVFYGGINVYLEEKFPPWRWLPGWMRRVFDAPWLLGLASRLDLSVQADKLGGVTLSMARGEHGHQRKELNELIDWLRREARPDVVHLSNALMLGMARQIRQKLNVPIVCTLAGEDIFLEALSPQYKSSVHEELRQRVPDVDHFVALNHYYADFMAEYLDVPRQQTSIVPHGLKLAGHGERKSTVDGEFVIGYFARLCPAKGLHHLVDAFIELSKDKNFPPLKLKIAGYLGGGDRRYVADLEQRWIKAGLGERVSLKHDVSRDEKIAFLQSLDVMSVPADYRESKGISVLEALANGVPVVLPEHGAYPELIADTQGGIMFKPHDAKHLAVQLRRLIYDRNLLDRLGKQGQAAVHNRYNDDLMAERHRAMYRNVIESFGQRATLTAPQLG